MTTDRDLLRRAHAVLSQVIDLEPEQRRDEARKACSDDLALRQMVFEMLDAADQEGLFLDAPAPPFPATPPQPIPAAIGTYQIVGVLGTGGMATVYEAIQDEPRRRVALKVVHQRLAGPDIHARFRFETEALARLHHPAIAQIYEAGTAGGDREAASPFFVMELIPQALPITDYVEQKGMTLPQRLELFLTVCDAVQHGHQDGVIHRDIKAANVLVDNEGRPKVIDFGIARATETQADSATGTVEFRQLLGTLYAMSPEQCDSAREVDIRTDVYSLGVLLYELVTGELPLDLSGRSIPEAIRIITEVEPPPASRFRPEAAGDLDAILAVAMDKDRERRYASATALAADIRRHLADLPIEARPASRFDQVRKFVRRNRGLSIASLAASVLLVVGSILSTRLAYVEKRAREAAEQRERQLQIVMDFQASLLRNINPSDLGQKLHQSFVQTVERSFDEPADHAAQEASKSVLLGLADRVNFTSLALGMLSDSILDRYRESIQTKFSEDPIVQSQLLQQLAGTMNTLGLHAKAEPILRDTLRIRRKELGPDHADTLLTQHSLGSLLSTLGNYDEAVRLLRQAYDARARLFGADHAVTLRTGTSLGGALRRKGDLVEAERIWKQTLEDQQRVLGEDDPETLQSLSNIGVVYASQGRLEEAESCWRELLERQRRTFGDDHPSTRSVLGNLCGLLQDQGEMEEAGQLQPLLSRALIADRKELGDRHSQTLMTMAQLASLLLEREELAAAEKLQRECLEGRQASLGDDHPATHMARTALARILLAAGDLAEAELLTRTALDAQRRILGNNHPETIGSMGVLSQILRESSDVDQALALSGEAIERSRRALPGELWSIGQLHSDHGSTLVAANRPMEAIPFLEEGYKRLEAAFGSDHPKTRAAASRLKAGRAAANQAPVDVTIPPAANRHPGPLPDSP